MFAAGETELYAVFLKLGNKDFPRGTRGCESAFCGVGVFKLALYYVFAEFYLRYPVVFQMFQKLAVGYLGVDVCRGAHELVHRKHTDEYGYPKYKILKNIC